MKGPHWAIILATLEHRRLQLCFPHTFPLNNANHLYMVAIGNCKPLHSGVASSLCDEHAGTMKKNIPL